MNQTSKVISVIAVIAIIAVGIYIYRLIYPPVVAVDPAAQEVQAIKQEVIKERIIIKEVIKDAKKEAVAIIDNLPNDAIADEWNERLRQYRSKTSGDSSE